MNNPLMRGIYKGLSFENAPLVRHLMQDRILELKEQIALMAEEPLRL
jgi:hypothetical protein